MEIKTEIEKVDDRKPTPALAPFNGQNELKRSDLNESEILNDDINICIGLVFSLKDLGVKIEGIILLKFITQFLPNICVIFEFLNELMIFQSMMIEWIQLKTSRTFVIKTKFTSRMR